MRTHLVMFALVSSTPACDAAGSTAGSSATASDTRQDVSTSASQDDVQDVIERPNVYSLDSATSLTSAVGREYADTDESACQGKFVAVGVAAFASYPDSYFRLITVNVRCAQLKSNGLGTLVSDGAVVGRLPVGGADGSNQASNCAAGQLMVGVTYGLNRDGGIGGVAALCAPLDVWADPEQSPDPTDGKEIGDADTGTVTCPQGSALVALRASEGGTIQSLQAVCAEIFIAD